MGSASSKLKKKLTKGDEYSALSLIETNKDLQKKFNPNGSYGDHYNHDTPLHIAARHAMPRALRLFLFEYGGNPNKKNGLNESALHCACQLSDGRNAKNVAAHEECVNMLVGWQGDKLEDGTCEKLDVAAQDKVGNTALHYAAQSGFINCVKRLVDLGAPLFTENDARQTPCDLAEIASITTIAQYLESKMVFFVNEDAADSNESMEAESSAATEEVYQALRPQQLQEAKDTLIVETSDMLRVPLFTAEVLLRHHEWDKEVLLEAWISDPVTCCEKSGVVPPTNLNSVVVDDHELNILNTPSSHQDFQPSTCEICFDNIADPAEHVPMVCEHRFCQNCWKDYLDIKIKEGDAHNIVCPAVDCNILVPVEFIEAAVSSTMAQRYLHFDIKAFVAGNPRIVWCPHPGCGQAIQNPSRNRSASVTSRSSQHSMQYQPLEAHCESGHAFCWQCQGEPHDPASCDDYKRWLEKIVQMKEEELKDVTKKSEVAANTFWMLSNSKRCPNCKSPIEKNEGCNHMRCSKCKHDFCWVCLEPWKYHNSTTGGFFRCTRYEVVEKVDEKHQSDVTDASDKHKALQELNRFVHYYARYENHKHSLELEEPLLDKTKQKMAQLVNAHTLKSNKQSVAMDTMSRLAAARFIDEAISVLIKARRLLQFCYVYGYYLQGSSMKRMVFELLQTELEEKTEYLSEIVARPYLKTPKTQIVKITRQVADKTEEFFKSIANGLLPQDLPSQSDGASSSRSPWLVGSGPSTSADWLSDTDDSGDEPINRHDVCAAADCKKLKLRHSGAPDSHHDYCSLNCLKSDYINRSKRKAKHQNKERQLDLLQALEMSRLQLLQDMDSINTGSSSDVSGDEDVSLRRRLGINNTELPADPILEHVLRLSQSAYAEEQDEDLTLAIRMSLQSADVQRQTTPERRESRRRRAESRSESTNSSAAGSQHDGAGAAGGSTDEVYRCRVAELDNAIAELRNVAPIQETGSLRRTESDKRNSGRSNEGDSVSVSRPIRRTRSERREGIRGQSRNL